MDRQSIFGFVLIFIILVVWMWVNSPQPKTAPSTPVKQPVTKDSVKTEPPKKLEVKTIESSDQYGKFFTERAKGTERIIHIETDLYTAEISSKGGTIRSWELKNYKTWDGRPVQLVNDNRSGDLAVLLTTSDGKVINTKDLFFDVRAPGDRVRLDGNFEFEINFILPASNGGRLIKTMKFRNDEYGFDVALKLVNLAQVLPTFQYTLVWERGIRYAEHNSIDESSFAGAYAYAGSELTEIDATKFDEKAQKELSGAIDWVAMRNKYFGMAIIPTGAQCEGAFLEGTRTSMPDEGAFEAYSIAMVMPYRETAEETSTFKVFLGPLDLKILKSYGKGLENIMSLGWAWLIRPISEYVMLPVFTGIHYVVPNWGLVIIVFSILIKVVLHPLSKSSMKSMRKMQKLQPMMSDLREKYKDDPQRMNQAVMNLYKEYGVNPAGGCLPLLLQLPIMYALYAVFRGAIQLRQASFVGWITDLSVPDVIYRFPGKLPLIGIQDISGIAVLMGITMFIQQKMTVQDPRQKAMVWLMPIMMTLLFNGFPAGLNLYYAVFNILSIGQQMLINKQDADEPLRKVEQKKKPRGGIFRYAKDLPKLNK